MLTTSNKYKMDRQDYKRRIVENHQTEAKRNSDKKKRKWNGIGHKLCKEAGGIEKTALQWNPQGCGKRGRPKRTWRRTTDDEIRSTGRSWNNLIFA